MPPVWYDGRTMEQQVAGKRLTETCAGRAASLLLALTWLVSMGTVDTTAYSMYPTLLALGGVMLLTLSGMLCGGRMVRLGPLAWCSLAVGGYFLVRCLCSYSVVESWHESSLIVSCAIFYIAGVFGAHSRNGRLLMAVLCLALVINIVYYFWNPATQGMMRWTGRPAVGLAGANTPPVALFAYKNHACAFLMVSGCALLACAWWCARSRWAKICYAFVGLMAIVVSFNCYSRACYMILPVMILCGWFMYVVLLLCSGRRLGWLPVIISMLFAVGLLILLVELVWGNALATIANIDTHMRYYVWKYVFRAVLDAPVWGYGTMGAHWEIIDTFNEWATPNMAHNEYLQAWADYGPIGLLLMVAIIVAHSLSALRSLGRGVLTPLHRGMIAVSMLVLSGCAAISLADFMWHAYPIATITAFSCGVLASPVALPASGAERMKQGRPAVVGVRSQGAVGKGVLAMLCLLGMVFVGWRACSLREAWHAQWTYDDLSAAGADEDESKRRNLLARTMYRYPDSSLVDTYILLPSGSSYPDELEEMLVLALEGNPKQGYMLTLLADLYTRQERYAEAEIIMRRFYPQQGIPELMTRNWPLFYYNNLLSWSRNKIKEGDVSVGLSMAEYVINMRPSMSHTVYRWFGKHREYHKKYATSYRMSVDARYKALKHDAELLRRLGVQRDDSWMQPMEPGGKSALYPQWGLKSKKEGKGAK